MEDSLKRSKRKRTTNTDLNEGYRPSKVTKTDRISQRDNPILQNNVVPIVDCATEDAHTQLLDSIGGHIRELTHVNDSILEAAHDKVEPLSKSASRRLKKRNRQVESVPSIPITAPCDVDIKEAALDYLTKWSEEREKWSFKKKTQFWLLQNMYRKSKVPKASFESLLSYLEGLQGHQRQLVVDKAQMILNRYSEGNESEGSPTKREYKRAVSILRALA